MDLVQCRIVTDQVESMAAFYAGLVGADVALNGYYVEVPAGPATIGFSRPRFACFRADETACSRGSVILDFLTGDADAHYPRIAAMGVDWVLPPADQPWGSRSMLFRDPEGHLVNVFSRRQLRRIQPRPRVSGPARQARLVRPGRPASARSACPACCAAGTGPWTARRRAAA
jgi:predicted enzyme related to lactoylglutathione lyase